MDSIISILPKSFASLCSWTGRFESTWSHSPVVRFSCDVVQTYFCLLQVTSIDYNADTVTVSCKNGSQYEGSKVIVTVSLAILKERRIEFSPPLPVEKTEALDSLGVGLVEKVFYDFSPVTRKDIHIMSFVILLLYRSVAEESSDSIWARKPVFGVCDQIKHKPTCSATEIRYSLEILYWASVGF